ncbi:MAG: peptidylprolyl isomerase [Halioglobus sp.]
MTTNKSLLHKFLREPLLHFLLIGGALFLAYNLQNEDLVNNNQIIISEAEVDRLITLWERKKQRLPTQNELQNLIDQQVREEVMYREALAMGLDQNDGVVRRRLAQKVEFISADLAALVEPTEAELTDYLATHSNKFELPGRINFTQVYINSDKHGSNTQNYADSLLIELTQASSDMSLETLGDSVMLDQYYEQVTEHDVTRLFGKHFAKEIFSLSVGSWQGIISSGYGPHLVRIDDKTENRQPELDTVRQKVRTEWLAQQRREMDKIFYESLRQRYEVVIKEPLEKNTLANKKP